MLEVVAGLVLVWGVPIALVLGGHSRRRVTIAVRTLTGVVAMKLLGPFVRAVVVETANGRLLVDPIDQIVGRKLRRHGSYGLGELARLGPYLTSESRVLVVGAHLGSLVVPIAKRCRSVVAIEADPETFQLLIANLRLNEIANCQPFNVAASDKAEKLEFHSSRANSGGNKRPPISEPDLYRSDDRRVISVDAVALDRFLDDPRFDVVLMDIEGSEYHALKGMRCILDRCHLLVVEFVPHHLRNISGVGVDEFLAAIPPRFVRLTIPMKQLTVEGPDFAATLRTMVARNEADDGLMFFATPGRPGQEESLI